MRVILFAITGFGNKALDMLLEKSCEVILFTRKGRDESPYYPGVENLIVYAERKGIKVYDDFTWDEAEKIIKKFVPDFLLIDTFHRIIPPKIIRLVPLAVNIHPSLLPKYRGSTPIDWALYNQEKETGITAHLAVEEVDKGDILIQKIVLIEMDDNKQTLTQKLIDLSGDVINRLLEDIKMKNLTPQPQDEKNATFFPRFENVSEEERLKMSKK
jgi:methionyl-tRNA formyltransferase